MWLPPVLKRRATILENEINHVSKLARILGPEPPGEIGDCSARQVLRVRCVIVEHARDAEGKDLIDKRCVLRDYEVCKVLEEVSDGLYPDGLEVAAPSALRSLVVRKGDYELVGYPAGIP